MINWSEDVSLDAVMAKMEQMEEKLIETSIVVLCSPETKKFIKKLPEFSKSSNVYIIADTNIKDNKVYSVEEFGLKKEFIKLSQRQEKEELYDKYS